MGPLNEREPQQIGGRFPATRDSFKAMVENAPEILALISVEGAIRYVNAQTEKVLGYRKSEVEGRNIFDLIHPDDSARAAEEYADTVQHRGERVPSVLRLRDVKGAWIPFEIVANNRLEDPEIESVVFSARDLRFRKDIQDAIQRINADTTAARDQRITELAKANSALRIENQARHQAETNLQQTVSLLHATLDSTADGILVVSNSGKVTSCNKKFLEMWRINFDHAIVGKDDESLLAYVTQQLQNPNDFLDKVRALYADPSATSFDVLHFSDGRILERYSQPQLLDNEIVGRVWSFRDVTRARNLESELRQAQKMEALGKLAGGIAHDFNNLLMLISGYVTQMIETPSLAAAQGTCEQILAITKRAASVTRQLLAFSRKLPAAPIVADLNVILLDLERMLRRLLSDQIHLQIAVTGDPEPVYVDVSQIEVMIMNLAINAQDAMPEGGLLSIATSREVLSSTRNREEQNYVVLQVSDTGHGMMPEVRAHIFEPFFTTKKLGKGTGLGLSTVYGIVDRAGGHIEVQSEHNRGTTFRVYLPQAKDVALSEPDAPPVSPTLGGDETILLAEDESGIRAMTRAYLEGLGYRVLEAADGSEAITCSLEYGGSIHLVLTDILMPGIRGDAAFEEIRKQRPEIKAIFMSGYTDQDLAGDLGSILYKPFEFAELGRRLRFVLDGNLETADPGHESAAD